MELGLDDPTSLVASDAGTGVGYPVEKGHLAARQHWGPCDPRFSSKICLACYTVEFYQIPPYHSLSIIISSDRCSRIYDIYL